VVGRGRYCIAGKSLIHNFQETILMPWIVGFMVEIVKQKHENSDIWPLYLVKPFSFHFIELSNSSLVDGFTPHSSSTILPNLISQFSSLQIIVSIITIVFCFVITTFILLWKYSVGGLLLVFNGTSRIELQWATNFGLWQDTIQKIQFFSTIFGGDVLFELSPLLPNANNSSKMQGMDKKNDGHAWCKVITTNIKNSFGPSFRKIHCLGHLHCV
jgi:hypothetical protein